VASQDMYWLFVKKNHVSLWMLQDEEVLHTWLVGLRLDDYYQMFVIAGYDMPTISRMTPEVGLAEFCFIILVAYGTLKDDMQWFFGC